MAAHTHPHSHIHFPIPRFTVNHPYAADWLLLVIGSIAALLLWLWNS